VGEAGDEHWVLAQLAAGKLVCDSQRRLHFGHASWVEAERPLSLEKIVVF
jgi:hypothetical protein